MFEHPAGASFSPKCLLPLSRSFVQLQWGAFLVPCRKGIGITVAMTFPAGAQRPSEEWPGHQSGEETYA